MFVCVCTGSSFDEGTLVNGRGHDRWAAIPVVAVLKWILCGCLIAQKGSAAAGHEHKGVSQTSGVHRVILLPEMSAGDLGGWNCCRGDQ